ncbi:sodium-dependent bicarbonate transport family permease [Pseudohaliea rubra]|nr:sodium-dependent bicarbonate transport family permease [Pseudohaliea rubra]
MSGTFFANLTSPPLLFFCLGLLATFARSDLDIPNPVAKAVSIYLLLAIGFKGGVALSESPFSVDVLLALGAALLLAAAVPVFVYFMISRWFDAADAAAVAATYGSISAVTFVTATHYLDSLGIAWGGHFVAAMALMEAPAIVVGLYLYRRSAGKGTEAGAGGVEETTLSELLREAFLNGSVVLILGSLLIGWVNGKDGMDQLAPFVKAPFVGMLCIFLLDMGLVAARRLRDLQAASSQEQSVPLTSMVGFAVLLPALNGSVALLLAVLAGMSEGDALLLTILGASASYIAVPAAMRLALPAANPGIYLTMALAVTFPLNIILGIPLFHLIIQIIAN